MFDIAAKYQPQNSFGNPSGNLIHRQEKERDDVVSAKLFPLVQTSVRQNTIYPSLEVSQPGDESEVEADRMADTVMRMEDEEGVQKKDEEEQISKKEEEETLSRKCDGCKEEEESVQRKESSSESIAPVNFNSSLSSSKGNGSPLSSSTQTFMESGFGHDFSNVKIHTDSNAVQMSKDVNAQAFTHGSDIYFNSGKYNPDSSSGKHLLAHELTHTIQQGKSVQKKVNHSVNLKPAPTRNAIDKQTDLPDGKAGKHEADLESGADMVISKPVPIIQQKNLEEEDKLNRKDESNSKSIVLPELNTSSRKHLLAHELMHVQQQEVVSKPTLQRSCSDPAFCTPYATTSEADSAEWWIRNTYLRTEGLETFGTEVKNLYESYLSRSTGDSLAPVVFASDSSYIVQSFKSSWDTKDDIDSVIDLVSSRLSRAPGTLRNNSRTVMSLSNFLSAAEMENRPINYSNPFSVAGHIAGGIGSSDAGNDYRKITYANVALTKVPLIGSTGYVLVELIPHYEVFDAIDFCPGDCGSPAEQLITVPMSRLEAGGQAYDVPFKVIFTPQTRSKRFWYFNLDVLLKLNDGEQNDPLEKEADQMADNVMRMEDEETLNRKCEGCEKEESVQRKESNSESVVLQGKEVHKKVNKSYELQGKIIQKSDENITNSFSSFSGKNVDEKKENKEGKLLIWIKAFIPGEISGYTKTVPGGTHKGEKMVPGPTPISDCFLTDNRDFSKDIDAGSRINQIFEIDLSTMNVLTHNAYCDETIELDCGDGDVECSKQGDSSNIKYQILKQTPNYLELSIKSSSNNPCFTGSPAIDYNGKIKIDKSIGMITFIGNIDQFPFFEMYAKLDKGNVVNIFNKSALPGKTPGDLWGDADRPVTGEKVFRKMNQKNNDEETISRKCDQCEKDEHEKEADQMADKVTTIPEPKNADNKKGEENKNQLLTSNEKPIETNWLAENSKQVTEKITNETPSTAEENVNTVQGNVKETGMQEVPVTVEVSVEVSTEEKPVAEAITPEATEIGSAKEGGEKKKEGTEEEAAIIESPKTPEDDPAFQKVLATNKKVGGKQKSHGDPVVKAGEAQMASKPPGNDVESKAMASQVEKMGASKENVKKFDAAVFKEKLKSKIEAAIPKSEDEAKEFKDDNKLENVKGELQTDVQSEKENATGPIETTAKEEPSTEGIEGKTVEPLNNEEPGEKPSIPGAGNAAPKARTDSELSMEEDAKSLDDEMAKNEVSEEQLANSNEPEFTGALESKQESQKQVRNAPNEYRETENPVLQGAENEAQTSVAGKLEETFAARQGLLGQVDSSKTSTKTKDEEKRKEVADGLNSIYETTKTKVETILTDLETTVMDKFDTAAKAANKVFEDNVSRRLDDHYGFFTIDDTISEWVSGLPPEINEIFMDEKQKFIDSMETVIDSVAMDVETKLNEASAEIETGKNKVKEYVDNLDPSLKKFGEETATEILGKFDELEQQVEAKQDEIADGLTKKYVENVGKLQESFDKIKDSKKGWLSGAFDALAGVFKTILELKNMLVNTLSRIIHVVGAIISDPIGFLGNLIDALMMGLGNFKDNIVTHLKKGFFTWLMGNMPPGIQFPDVWDLKGIFTFIMQILGLTWSNIRQRAVTKLGEPVVKVLEEVFEIFQVIQKDGLAGLWNYIKEKIGDLKVMVIDAIQDFLVESVIKAGIMWVIGLLNPAGAFIKACKLIYDIVMFFVEKGRMILEFVNSVIDSIAFIVEGNLTKAAKYVEDSLAKLIPIAIGFLASLLGLSGVSEKVQEIIKKIQVPINKAIDWVIDKAIALAKKLGIDKLVKKVKGGIDKGKQWAKDKIEKGKAALSDWWKNRKKFTSSDGEGHSIYFEGEGSSAKLMIATTPMTVKNYLTKEVKDKHGLTDNDIKAPMKTADEIENKEKVVTTPATEANKVNDMNTLLGKLAEEIAALPLKTTGQNSAPMYGPLYSGKFGTSATVAFQQLPYNAGSGPTVSDQTLSEMNIRKNGNSPYYIRGHLLNDNLGGPGNAWKNLTPISSQANSDHKNNFENPVKLAVYGGTGEVASGSMKAKGLMKGFSVAANYGRAVPLALAHLQADPDDLPTGADPLWDAGDLKKILEAEKFVPTELVCRATVKEENATAEKNVVYTVDNEISYGDMSNYQLGLQPTVPVVLADIVSKNAGAKTPKEMAQAFKAEGLKAIGEARAQSIYEAFKKKGAVTNGKADLGIGLLALNDLNKGKKITSGTFSGPWPP